MTTHGIREDQGRRAGKEKEKEQKGKEKDDKVEDSGDRGTKEKEKERETKNNFAGDESYWAQDDGQGTETESWNDGFWANEDETPQSRGCGESQEDSYNENGYYQGKGTKERQDKERKAMDLNKIKEKHKAMGKEKQTM